MNAIVMDMTKE